MHFIFIVHERPIMVEGNSIYNAINKTAQAMHVERNAVVFDHNQLKDVIVSEGTHDPLALLASALPFMLDERMERRARTATSENAPKRWEQVRQHLERLAPNGYVFGTQPDAPDIYKWYKE